MKKFYLKKSAIAAALSAVLLGVVSCGLAFTEITFSSHSVEQGKSVTITAKFERPNDEYQNNENIWVYYGVRVPEDWSTAEMPKIVDITEYNGAVLNTEEYELEESAFYTKLMEVSYPREGYKWIGYQSKEVKSVYGQPATATLVLNAGQTLGSYEIDFIAGSSKSAPAEMLDANGDLNYEIVFSYTDEQKYINGQQYKVYQEYLANASTLSNDEIDARMLALSHITVGGLPISRMDISNVNPEFDRHVDVVINTGVDDVTADVQDVEVNVVAGGIEVEAEGAVATVCNLSGAIVGSVAVNGVSHISVSNGLYVVKVQTLKHVTCTKVVVK